MLLYEGEGKWGGNRHFFVSKDIEAAKRKARREQILPDTVRQALGALFECYIAGTSHKNRNGSNRQVIVAKCRNGESLIVFHESDNRHDKHALALWRQNGEQVGYVPQGIAKLIVEGFVANAGCRIKATVLQVRTFREDTDLLTADMQIEVFDAATKDGGNFPLLRSVETKFNVANAQSRTTKPSKGCLGVVIMVFASLALLLVITLGR